jgi:uncharacterized delta-60 repeat protein
MPGLVEHLERRLLLSVDPIDPSFGDNGVALTSPPAGQSYYAGDAVTQPDGKLLLGIGSSVVSNTHFPLARFDASGKLDTSFGDNGWALINAMPARRFNGGDIELQSDGRILVFGTQFDFNTYDHKFALARYKVDGTPEIEFGSYGVAITDTPYTEPGFISAAQAASVTLAPEGKIVVSGASGAYWTVARYLSNGALDITFDGDGLKNVGLIGLAQVVKVQPDGKIIVAGNSDNHIAVARLNVDGSFDTSFGGAGTGVLNLLSPGSTSDFAQVIAMTLRADGGIVFSGWQRSVAPMNGPVTPVIYTLLPDGTTDPSFGDDGRVIVPLGSIPGYITSDVNGLTLMPDGSLVACCRALIQSGSSQVDRLVLLRYSQLGELVKSFGADGEILSPVLGYATQANLVDGDKLLIASSVGTSIGLSRFFTGPTVYARSGATRTTEILIPPPNAFGSVGAFTVQRGGDLSDAITLTLFTSGTATSGDDYQPFPTSITFPAGSDTAVLPVTAVDDYLFEGDETVKIQLTPPPGFIDATAAEVNVVITDNEGPDRFEPDDQINVARDMGTVGRRVEPKLSIHIAGDVDVYRVATQSAGRMLARITFPAELGNLKLELIDSAGTVVAMSDGSSGSAEVAFDSTSGKTFRVRVSGAPGATNPDYQLLLANLPRVTTRSFNVNSGPSTQWTFTSNVGATIDAADMSVLNLDTHLPLATAPTAVSFSSSIATFTYGGGFPDGNYRATVHASGIADTFGNPLAEDSSLDFFVLKADANRDREVDSTDFNILARYFGQSQRVFVQGDFNYDGKVDSIDFTILAAQFGKMLDPPELDATPAFERVDGALPAERRVSQGLFAAAVITPKHPDSDLLARLADGELSDSPLA